MPQVSEIHDLMDDLKRMSVQKMTVAEQKALGLAARAGDVRAGQELVSRTIPLAVRQAVRAVTQNQCRGVHLGDIVAEAVIGLSEALEHYKPELGAFTTLARWWVDLRIRNALSPNRRSLIALPPEWAVNHRTKQARLRQIDRIRKGLSGAVSADSGWVAHGKREQGDDNGRLEALVRSLWQLPERTRDVLLRRANREGNRQIAKRWGISGNRVCEIERKGMRDLARMLGADEPAMSICQADRQTRPPRSGNREGPRLTDRRVGRVGRPVGVSVPAI